jgi:hypothetical protein
MLDLNENIDNCKTGKILTQQRRIKHLKRAKRFKRVEWADLMEEREKNIIPLNLNIGFQRLT